MAVTAYSPALRELLEPDAELEPLADGFEFVEGPVWNPDGYLLFSDIPVILRWDASGVSEWRRPSQKSNGLTYDGERRLVAREHSTSRVTRTEHDGTVRTIASHWQGKELNSPNDVVVRSDGSVYFTDPWDGRKSNKRGLERPLQLDFKGVYMAPVEGGETVLLADDLPFPNGLCFSPDERILYVNDRAEMHILRRPPGRDGRERPRLLRPGGDGSDGGRRPRRDEDRRAREPVGDRPLGNLGDQP